VGTIRERKPGHFEIRAYLGRSPSGSPRYVQETYVHHRKDGGIQAARKRLREIEGQADKQRSTTSLSALLEDWLNHARKIGRAPSTVAAYERRVAVIKDALGDIQLGRLSAKDLDQWYGTLLAAGRSPADVKAFHRIISAALRQGEKWDSVDRNIAGRADPPRVPRVDIEPPSPAEVETLIRLAQDSRSPEMAPIIFWCAISGMRRGEVAGLHWSRVDWDGARVYVCRSVWQVNQRIGEKDTKSHQTRWVSVGELGIALLKDRRARGEADATDAGVDLEPDGYVWSTDVAGREPWHPDRITQAFTRLCVKAGLPGDPWPYRLHDLRHYSATELLTAGVPLNVVSERLGHARASTTSDIYGHGRAAGDQLSAEILGAGLSAKPQVSALNPSAQDPSSAPQIPPVAVRATPTKGN
jgi:integrase